MPDPCVHCGHAVTTVPYTGQLVHTHTETIWCKSKPTMACLSQGGVE